MDKKYLDFLNDKRENILHMCKFCNFYRLFIPKYHSKPWIISMNELFSLNFINICSPFSLCFPIFFEHLVSNIASFLTWNKWRERLVSKMLGRSAATQKWPYIQSWNGCLKQERPSLLGKKPKMGIHRSILPLKMETLK